MRGKGGSTELKDKSPLGSEVRNGRCGQEKQQQRPVVETGMAGLRNKRSVCPELNDGEGDEKTQTIRRPCLVKISVMRSHWSF